MKITIQNKRQNNDYTELEEKNTCFHLFHKFQNKTPCCFLFIITNPTY